MTGGDARGGAAADFDAIASWQAKGDLVEVARPGAAPNAPRRRLFRIDRGPRSGCPAALILHGFPTSSHDFSPVLARLEDRFRLVAFDMLGYGFSEKPAGHRYSLLEQADLAEAIAAAAGLERFHLVAHDMGASVALELLSRPGFASRLDGVTLLNGGLLLAVYRPRLIQRLLRLPVIGDLVARLVTRRAFGRTMRGIFAPAHPPSEALLSAMWALVEREQGVRGYARLIRYIDERHVHEPRWLAALALFPRPVTLLWGMQDPISGAVGPALAAQHPAIRLVRFDGLGHYPQLEDPDALAAALADAIVGAARQHANDAAAPGARDARAETQP